MNVQMGANPVQDSPAPTISFVTAIDAETARLCDVIARLEDRLAKVLGPDYRDDAVANMPAPVMSEISMVCARLSTNVNLLESLLVRIEA